MKFVKRLLTWLSEATMFAAIFCALSALWFALDGRFLLGAEMLLTTGLVLLWRAAQLLVLLLLPVEEP